MTLACHHGHATSSRLTGHSVSQQLLVEDNCVQRNRAMPISERLSVSSSIRGLTFFFRKESGGGNDFSSLPQTRRTGLSAILYIKNKLAILACEARKRKTKKHHFLLALASPAFVSNTATKLNLSLEERRVQEKKEQLCYVRIFLGHTALSSSALRLIPLLPALSEQVNVFHTQAVCLRHSDDLDANSHDEEPGPARKLANLARRGKNLKTEICRR
ncbi:hypothetical protein BaRGS_00034477 [Batillaria attramentaria]|uniref:Uncharacterized protein n=1 Tax=Batillaria attramentaria TaxID=370345 RepID=A0ABD0JHU3_9CAEN